MGQKDLVAFFFTQNKFGSNDILSPKLFGGDKNSGPKTFCPGMS